MITTYRTWLWVSREDQKFKTSEWVITRVRYNVIFVNHSLLVTHKVLNWHHNHLNIETKSSQVIIVFFFHIIARLDWDNCFSVGIYVKLWVFHPPYEMWIDELNRPVGKIRDLSNSTETWKLNCTLQKTKNDNKTGVINDPLGQPHSPNWYCF